MKENRGLKIAVIILFVLVLGLIAYIIFDKVSSQKSQNEMQGTDTSVSKNIETTVSDTVEESGTAEKSDTVKESGAAEESETLESDTSNSEKSEGSEKSENPKNSKMSESDKTKACYATIREENSWEDGKYYVCQYSVDVRNSSDEDLDNWEVKINGFSNAEIGDSWNADLKISGDVLSCKAVDYNKKIAAKNVTNFGFQAKFKNKDDSDKEKGVSLYTNGEVYTKVKEEPVTASKEEKKVSKKEKVEPETGTPLENHGKLSIKGTDIVDKNGKKYQLKGISTHGIAWFPDYVNKDAFKTLRDDWDANLIRIAMYTGESGGYCQDGDQAKLKKLVEDGVGYATELGMYVIVDWHILSDNNPGINEDEAIKFFDEISAEYADYDNVLYEICNEPNGSTTWDDIKSYAEKVIPVIRENDKDAIIIVGTPTWSQDVEIAAADPIEGQENIAYTLHFYAATHKDNIRDKAKTALDKGLCLFVSEFSICDASGNGGIDYDSAEEWFKLINDNNISYAAWNLSNKNETSTLIDSACDKTSGWSDDELSDTGVWIKSMIRDE